MIHNSLFSSSEIMARKAKAEAITKSRQTFQFRLLMAVETKLGVPNIIRLSAVNNDAKFVVDAMLAMAED